MTTCNEIDPDNLNSYLEKWAKAQQTNDPEDWKEVQLTDVWANDLNDGNGYQQQSYAIWPIY